MSTDVVSETEHAYILAERNAAALLAYSSSELPAANERVKSLLATRLIEDTVNFSLHARRFLQAADLKPEIRQVLVNRRVATGPSFERSLHSAVSAIIHATYLNVLFDRSPYQGFRLGQTEWAPVLACETDQRPRFLIDIYSMAWSFLELEEQFLALRAKQEVGS